MPGRGQSNTHTMHAAYLFRPGKKNLVARGITGCLQERTDRGGG